MRTPLLLSALALTACDKGVQTDTATPPSDCEGEGGTLPTWYADADGDGFGDPNTTAQSCARPEGFTDNADDCDDTDNTRYPDAPELCSDGVINSCNGTQDQAWEQCGHTGWSNLRDADVTLRGIDTDDSAGSGVDWAGDVNGDGIEDIVVGAGGAQDGDLLYAGAAYVVLGPVSGTMDLANAHAAFLGEQYNGIAGWRVAGAGDVNGDGLDDLLIGAQGESHGVEQGGAAYLVLAPFSGTTKLSDSAAIFIGETAYGKLGEAIAGAGDLNGDGLADLIIGDASAQVTETRQGAAYIFYGPVTGEHTPESADAVITGNVKSSYAGAGVSTAGDLNGDGQVDLLVGAYHGDSESELSGYSCVFLSPLSDQQSLADAEVCYVAEHKLGAAKTVASAGDVDGDGLPDILIGAQEAGSDLSRRGAAYLIVSVGKGEVSLANSEAILLGVSPGSDSGAALDGAGDMNGDGHADILVAAPDERGILPAVGHTYLVLGPVSGTQSLADSDAIWIGEADFDHAGTSVAGGGDINGDGLGDVLIGAPRASHTTWDEGAVYLQLGGGW